MLNFDRILFPIDFSARCEKAAPYVDSLARKFGSRLFLLHVVDSEKHFESDLDPGPLDNRFLDAVRHDRETALRAFASRQFEGRQVDTAVLYGDPAESIVACAEEQKAGLIVMPTHGRGRFRALLLGSVTSKVLHDAQCAVWTTSHSELLRQDSFEDARPILCAADLSAGTAPLLQTACQLAESLASELRIVHAIPSPELQPDEIITEAPFPRFLFDSATEQIEALQAEAHTNIEVSIDYGSVPSVLQQAAERFGAQLIVIGRGHIAKPLGRLRTNVSAIIRASPCPVLSI